MGGLVWLCDPFGARKLNDDGMVCLLDCTPNELDCFRPYEGGNSGEWDVTPFWGPNKAPPCSFWRVQRTEPCTPGPPVDGGPVGPDGSLEGLPDHYKFDFGPPTQIEFCLQIGCPTGDGQVEWPGSCNTVTNPP